jgi:dienelactone hydrolase
MIDHWQCWRVFCVWLAVLAASAVAPAEEPTLLQGAAYSEDVAAAKLMEMARRYPNREAWQQRAAMLRQGILQGLQLDGIERPTDLRVIRHSKREFDGYTVENIAIESLPGFWITGNLYLPATIDGKIPAVLNPHGHWPDGRLRDDMQIRCAAQARMGAAALAYDMVGFGESTACEHRADSRVLRLQTFNSMRVVDFLLSLSFVDGNRLAITGASGGGTQSFLLAAVDDRIDLSMPVVMVSAHFFGGCVCESGMPIHKTVDYETNNVEIAGLIAPKPLLVVSDGDDWTSNLPQVEYPHLQKIYGMFDATGRVQNAHFADEGHDYGRSKREATYRFLANHFALDLSTLQGDDGNINESFVELQTADRLKVFVEPHVPQQRVTCAEANAWLDARRSR